MSLFIPKYINEAVPLTKKQSKEVNANAWRKWKSHKWNNFLFFAVLFGTIASQSLVIQFIEYQLGIKLPWWQSLLFFLTFNLSVWISFYFLHIHRFIPLYRHEVREIGYDICIDCGYWLHGLNEDVENCPECGAERDLISLQQQVDDNNNI